MQELVKKIGQCPKVKKNLEKKLFFVKMFFGHLECSSNIHVKKLEKKPKSSCSMSENNEKFQLFSKTDFFQNDSIDTKNAVLTGRPNFSCSITGNDLKKSPKKCKNFSKKFSSKSSQGEVESSLKATLTCFGQPAKNFPLGVQKNNNL